MKTVLTSRAVCMACFMICLGVCSCFDEDETVTLEGIVQFVEVEGGCWRIAGDDGASYEPINLSEEFQEDGLRVRFRAKYRTDLVSRCMVGRLVEILSISGVPTDE